MILRTHAMACERMRTHPNRGKLVLLLEPELVLELVLILLLLFLVNRHLKRSGNTVKQQKQKSILIGFSIIIKAEAGSCDLVNRCRTGKHA